MVALAAAALVVSTSAQEFGAWVSPGRLGAPRIRSSHDIACRRRSLQSRAEPGVAERCAEEAEDQSDLARRLLLAATAAAVGLAGAAGHALSAAEAAPASAAASAPATAPRSGGIPAVKRLTRDEDVYFGVGNFKNLQHEFVLKEADALGRRGEDITTLAGYAGGTRTGPEDTVCFKAVPGLREAYDTYGHAQAVRVSLPHNRITEFVNFFIDEVGKRKSFETGAKYRPLIGLKKGVKSPLFVSIQEVAAASPSGSRLRFVEGAGNEDDGYDDGVVYVYDSRKFPFRQAEGYNQFQNDVPTMYTSDYRRLETVLRSTGFLISRGCL